MTKYIKLGEAIPPGYELAPPPTVGYSGRNKCSICNEALESGFLGGDKPCRNQSCGLIKCQQVDGNK